MASPTQLEIPEIKRLHSSPLVSKKESPTSEIVPINRAKPLVRQDTPINQNQQAETKLDIVKLHSNASNEIAAKKSPVVDERRHEEVRRGLKYDGEGEEAKRLKGDGAERRSDELPRYGEVRKKARRSLSLRRERSREDAGQLEVYGPELGCLPWDSSEWLSVLKGMLAELLGVAFFMVFLVGAFSSAAFLHNANQSQLQIAITAGFSMTALNYALGPASGAHLNPAVSFMLVCTKKITCLRAFAYVCGQCAGAIIGAKLAQIVNPEGFRMADGAINQRGNFTIQQALGAEILGTAFLVFMVSSVRDSNNNQPDRANAKQSLGVLAVGIGYLVPHLFLLPITNCAINPARALGTSVVAERFPDQWIYWVGPAIGSGIALLLYECVIKDRPKAD